MEWQILQETWEVAPPTRKKKPEQRICSREYLQNSSNKNQNNIISHFLPCANIYLTYILFGKPNFPIMTTNMLRTSKSGAGVHTAALHCGNSAGKHNFVIICIPGPGFNLIVLISQFCTAAAWLQRSWQQIIAVIIFSINYKVKLFNFDIDVQQYSQYLEKEPK